MNKQAFVSLLKNPDKISASDIDGLEEVLLNFPYFQAAHILNAKGYKDQGKMLAGQKIKKAALYSAERRELKNLLADVKENTSVTPKETVIQETKKTPVYAISTIDVSTPPSPIAELKKEDSKPVNNATDNLSASISSVSEITKEEKEVSSVSSSNKETQETDNNSYKEKLSAKYISDSVRNQFFEELQRNLQSLREMKKRTADELSTNKKEEESTATDPAPSTISQPAATISTPEKLIEHLYELPPSSNRTPENEIKLIPEKVKEHKQEEELFTSRLDSVIYSSEKPDRSKAIDESDLLLGYLSFLETSKKPIAPKQKVNDIIDRFIKQDPSISPLDKSKINEEQLEDKSANSSKPAAKIVSENMAKIFLLQGKKDKALEIYEQLLLKYPEKKTYFETQIENIKSK